MKNPLFKNYKHRAEKSGKDFSISKDSFNFISEGQCYYCGIKFDKKYEDSKVNGIDRFDNELGYTDENCVPSCWICNRAKSNLSVNDFYKWVDRLSNNLKYIFDNTKTIDEKVSEDTKRHSRSNCMSVTSYEESVLNRAAGVLDACHFPSTLVYKIVKNVKTDKNNVKYLVRFIYNLDMLVNPASSNAILEELGTPDYLVGVIPSTDLRLDELDPILSSINFTKKERKSLFNVSKRELVLMGGEESKRVTF